MTKFFNYNKISASMGRAENSDVNQEYTKLQELIEEAKTVGQNMEQISGKLFHAGKQGRLSEDLRENKRLLDVFFRNCDDLNCRFFSMPGRQAMVFYLEGMVDMERLEVLIGNLQGLTADINDVSGLAGSYLANAKITKVGMADAAADATLRGGVLVVIDGMATAFVVDIAKYVKREVSESRREGVLRGSYVGFNETLSDNLVLIRRSAPDTALKVKELHIGERTRTKIIVLYVDGLAKRSLVEEVLRRIKAIRIDKVLYAGVIEEFIIDNPWSPFPQTQATERPDKVIAGVYEGRVAIMVDNTPWVLIVPCNYNQLLQTSDDYTTQPLVASFLRILRHLSAFIAIYTPGIYVALVSYHVGILPSALVLSIAELRAQSPFPAFLEALVMELILEIFQEATARLPDKIVVAASVVGGFVIGNTVVEAGLANPLLVVVIAMAAIASYTIPSYSLNLSLRWLRIPIIIMAAVFGLYGIAISTMFLLVHMTALNSFGESYFGAIFDVTMVQDWKDMLIRFPHRALRARPKVFGAADRMRVDNET